MQGCCEDAHEVLLSEYPSVFEISALRYCSCKLRIDTLDAVITVPDVCLDGRSNRKMQIKLSASADVDVLTVLLLFPSWAKSGTDNTSSSIK